MTGRILPDLRPTATVLPMPAVVHRRRGGPIRVTVAAVTELFHHGVTRDEMCRQLDCSLATIAKRLNEAGLVKKRVARAYRQSRHQPRAMDDKPATMPPANHPAMTEKRTLYPSTVVPVEGLLNVLVSGVNSHKIGTSIEKGKWKGFPVFTLTLEERATCPTSCHHWRSCFGNNMNYAKRIVHGPAFEERLGHELAILQSRYPEGFAVRLHVLGDFYSVGYVELWRSFLARFPAFHAFGFSARWNVATDPIAAALVPLIAEQWERFAIRLSNAPADECTTISIEHPVQAPEDAVICPQQLGKTASCGTCGLCWHSRRRIAFLRH